MPLQSRHQFQPEIDHRKAVLLLRWLLIILASYLTLFSHLGTRTFTIVFGVAIAFAGSNVALMLLPPQKFPERDVQITLAFMDLFFVCSTIYFLRVPETYLWLTFIGVFVLALLWRDLRLVLFSIFAVSLLFGAFTYF